MVKACLLGLLGLLVVFQQASGLGSSSKHVVKSNTQVNWRDAMERLFVRPRAGPMEVDEVRELLNIMRGQGKVGYFSADELIELERASEQKCDPQDFEQFSRLFRLADTYSKQIEPYLAYCLARQVRACKFESNFKSQLAVMDNEQDRLLSKLGDLARFQVPPIERADRANMVELPRVRVNAVALAKHMLELFNGFNELADQSPTSEQTSEARQFVDRVRVFCRDARWRLEANLVGALRSEENKGDKFVRRWFSSITACRALEENHPEVKVKICKQLEAKNPGTLNYIKSSIRNMFSGGDD